jgi:hypothetical protein
MAGIAILPTAVQRHINPQYCKNEIHALRALG